MVIFRGKWDGNVFFRKKYWYQWFFGGFATPSPMVNHHYHLMFFSPLTIAFNGFSYKPLKKNWNTHINPMVLRSLNHHHWMIFSPQTIAFNGVLMVFRFEIPMVNYGFEKAILKFSPSQIRHFSNLAILKFSNGETGETLMENLKLLNLTDWVLFPL